MADNVDIATDYLEQVTAAQIAARVRYQGTSLSHCVECGEEIPQRRRELLPGVRLCVECQARLERRHP